MYVCIHTYVYYLSINMCKKYVYYIEIASVSFFPGTQSAHRRGEPAQASDDVEVVSYPPPEDGVGPQRKGPQKRPTNWSPFQGP